MNTVLLASKSFSRAFLLEKAKIPFTVIGQDANEQLCNWQLPLEQVVASIADHKMNHASIPAQAVGAVCFVLTADTLVQDSNGAIHGQPHTYENAVASLRALQQGSSISTAFCIDKKIMRVTGWETVARERGCVTATCEFVIPDSLIDTYIKEEPLVLQCAGAMVIEGYGQQFIKSIQGSYSAIMGLPLYEVRIALERLGFFS